MGNLQSPYGSIADLSRGDDERVVSATLDLRDPRSHDFEHRAGVNQTAIRATAASMPQLAAAAQTKCPDLRARVSLDWIS